MPGSQPIIGEDGVHELEGLSEGTARLVADLSIDDASGSARLSVPIVAATGMTAQYDVDDAEGFPVLGEGLHTLRNDDGLLILDEGGASAHNLVAGAATGTATLISELTGEPLLEVEIGDAP